MTQDRPGNNEDPHQQRSEGKPEPAQGDGLPVGQRVGGGRAGAGGGGCPAAHREHDGTAGRVAVVLRRDLPDQRVARAAEVRHCEPDGRGGAGDREQPGPWQTVPGPVDCWSLAATLTAPPVTNVESAASTSTSPASTPARASSPSSHTPSRIERAALTARAASSSCDVGTPKAAMTASPANFSTVPPLRSMQRRARSKYWETRRRTISGSAEVTSVVESTRSTKSTVASFRSTAPV